MAEVQYLDFSKTKLNIYGRYKFFKKNEKQNSDIKKIKFKEKEWNSDKRYK